jgi:hypothetical protein
VYVEQHRKVTLFVSAVFLNIEALCCAMSGKQEAEAFEEVV